MEFLYFLEGIRMPGLNEFMTTVTELGGETAFLVIALVVFWCWDKLNGYYVLAVGFFGTLFNQFLKITCRIPRPWVLDPEFTILEEAREAATGYSFPSGHSTIAVGTFGSMAAVAKEKWLRMVCMVVAVVVPFSRMYVGVHTPADVLVGGGMALVLVLLMKPIVYGDNGKNIPVVFGIGAALSLAFLAYVELWPFPEDIDAHNMESAVKNAYTLLGALLGLLAAYYFDDKKLHFPVKAVWWAQVLKVVIGLALVLAVKEGSKTVLEALCGGHMIARGIRYFLVVIMAGVVWPMSFRWFAKLGRKGE